MFKKWFNVPGERILIISFKMISKSFYLVSNDRKYFAVDAVKLVEAAPSSAARKPFQELGERA